MEQTFLTEIKIVKVRQLHDQHIPLSRNQRKHLIITGKNGCGKTSVLKELAVFLKYLVSDDYEIDDTDEIIAQLKAKLSVCKDELQRIEYHREIKLAELYARRQWNNGCIAAANDPLSIREKYKQGKFILAFYQDRRRMDIDPYHEIATVEPKLVYDIDEHPAKTIGKYLANLKFAQALATMNKEKEDAKRISEWLRKFEEVLQDIYDDTQLKLEFDTETYQFSIRLKDGRRFSLEHMSMGYAAVFDIVSDLLMRMSPRRVQNIEGIVLIDEVETHLHVALQKQIVPTLTKLFPNIQFIITSHSPFVLSSTENAVVYDLENECYRPNGMSFYPYEAVVEEHFNTNRLSNTLENLLKQYGEALVDNKNGKKNNRLLRKLEAQLDSVPEFLSQDFALAYQQLRLDHGR